MGIPAKKNLTRLQGNKATRVTNNTTNIAASKIRLPTGPFTIFEPRDQVIGKLFAVWERLRQNVKLQNCESVC